MVRVTVEVNINCCDDASLSGGSNVSLFKSCIDRSRRKRMECHKAKLLFPSARSAVRHCRCILSLLHRLNPSTVKISLWLPWGVCVCVGCLFHRVFWCPLATIFPDSGSVGLFDSCNLSRPGQEEIRGRNVITRHTQTMNMYIYFLKNTASVIWHFRHQTSWACHNKL